MHAGPTLLAASLNRCYYITSCRNIVRSITCGCVTCRRSSARPKHQILVQIPAECITPDSVFDRVGLDYAGSFILKYGSICKPVFIKAYICLFVSLSIKSSSFGASIRPHRRHIYCCFSTIYCTQRKTLLDME